MASLPSSTALATSLASARVGRGLRIIESSIWVAVMTGLSVSMQRAMIIFWIIGTASGLVSMPRSPRATMMPSEAWMISSIFSTASGFSILEMIGVSRPIGARLWTTLRRASISVAARTKLSAIQSAWCCSANSTSSWSFSVIEGMKRLVWGMFMPLRSWRMPPTMTRVLTVVSVASMTSSSSSPSSSRMRSCGRILGGTSWFWIGMRPGPPVISSVVRTSSSPASRGTPPGCILPTRNFGPWRSTSIATG